MNELNNLENNRKEENKIETQGRIISPKEGAQILWMSYRFSQGKVLLQHMLLGRLAYDNNLSILPENESEMLKLAKERILKTIHNKSIHMEQDDDEESKLAIEMEFSNMVSTFNKKGKRPESMEEILNQIVEADLHYLKKNDDRDLDAGRNREEVGVNAGQLKDVWGSQAITFILEGKPTGHAVFDGLFHKLREMFNSANLGDIYENTIIKLKEVINIYNLHHPEAPYNDENIINKLKNAKGKPY